MLGYMEQTVSQAITKALTAVGNFKPKYPFLSATKSALIYTAYHLKGNQNKLILNPHCLDSEGAPSLSLDLIFEGAGLLQYRISLRNSP